MRNWMAALGVLGLLAFLLGWGAGRQHAQALVRPDPQVQRGAWLYAAECQVCHGLGGNGAPGAPALDGARLWRDYPSQAALVDFIQARMPASRPGSLTRAQAEDLAAYLRSLDPLARPHPRWP
ncbi:MAG: cytochrome c [Firmicutes bacterium]|nr:cytochrome c [Bacillota bacterium]